MPGEVVFDGACGTGYGSHILSVVASKVYGFEIDEGCINQAKASWGEEKTEFKVADLNTCELPEVDVSVSIESIEHLTPEGMINFTNQLKEKTSRLIVVTVPYGGTSKAYINEPPSPATEKNDFYTDGDIDRLFTGEWKKFTNFMFGYSYFGVYFKKEPKWLLP